MDPATAKQFLISRVVEEAQVERISLSEVEKKMLYFTEVHTSLPDSYEVNEEFQRNYHQHEYEAKIASLLRTARTRDVGNSATRGQEWNDALHALKKEDHYILVMANLAFGGGSPLNNKNRARDFVIYIAVGVGLVVIAFLVSIWQAGR